MEDDQGGQGGSRRLPVVEDFPEGVDLDGRGMVEVGMPQKIRAVGSVKMIRRFFSGRRMCRRPRSMSTRGVPLSGRTARTSARVTDLSESVP